MLCPAKNKRLLDASSFVFDTKLAEFELTFFDPMHQFDACDSDRGAPKTLQPKHGTQTEFD
jgi:hypothetical protein